MFLSDLSLVCEQSRLHADSNFKTVKVTDSDLAYRFYLYFVKITWLIYFQELERVL